MAPAAVAVLLLPELSEGAHQAQVLRLAAAVAALPATEKVMTEPRILAQAVAAASQSLHSPM
jgi:hypothetical protein